MCFEDDVKTSKDSKLYQSLEALNEENINKFMNEECNSRTMRFSKEHDDKMRQMVQEKFGPEAAEKMKEIQDRRNKATDEETGKPNITRFNLLNSRLKKAIAAALVFFLVTGITMSTEAVRTPIIKLITDMQKEFTGISVDETITEVGELTEGAKPIEQVYTLEKVQQGYKLVSEDINTHTVIRQYENSVQSVYQFMQQSQRYAFYYDNEKTNAETIDIIFGEAFFSVEEDINYLVWFYDGYRFEIAGTLTQEDMIALAESINLKTKEE